MARNVSDEDFNFQPPLPTREVKPFEPPPWEKEQFERLARERAAQAAAEQAAAGALVEAERQEAENTTQAAVAAGSAMGGEEVAADRVNVVVATQEARETGVGDPPRPSDSPQVKGKVDEAQLAAMMMGLRAEEPPALGGAWVIALVSAIVMGAVGIVLLIWGIVALTRPNMGPTGTMGGMVLLTFGLIFLGACIWLGLRTLRQQGVL